MAYIDTQYLGKCETCRHCVGEIKCNTYCDHGEEYSPNLSKIPTADVVPRSEYESLRKRMFPSYVQACTEEEAIKTGYEYGKTAVAKEIFEEIEFDIHQLMFERDEHRAIAIEGVIANLKKKYTEDVNNG